MFVTFSTAGHVFVMSHKMFFKGWSVTGHLETRLESEATGLVAFVWFLPASHSDLGAAGWGGARAGHGRGPGRPHSAPSRQHGGDPGAQAECGVGAEGGRRRAQGRQQHPGSWSLVPCAGWLHHPQPTALDSHPRTQAGTASAEPLWLCTQRDPLPVPTGNRASGVPRACLSPVDRHSRWPVADSVSLHGIRCIYGPMKY